MRFPIRNSLNENQFWMAFIPASLLTALLVILFHRVYLTYFYIAPDLSQVLSAYRAAVTIKPGEILAYAQILVIWPIMLFLVSMFGSQMKANRNALVTSQIIIACFLLFNFFYQEVEEHYYFKSRWFLLPVIFAGLARFLFKRGSKQPDHAWLTRNRVGYIIFILSLLALLPCVFSESNFGAVHERITWHLPFVMEEFTSVFSGQTPLVDFFPMYSQLLPYGLAPIFNLLGFSIFHFTLLMAVLSAICIYSGYSILKWVSPRSSVTLFLFLGWYGMFVRPLEGAGGIRYSTFSYFALGPVRYFGFWSVAALTLKVAKGKMRLLPQFICTFWAGLVAINNLDLGFPALIGSAFVLLMSSVNRVKSFLMLAAGCVVAYATAVLLPFLRSGKLPLFHESISFQMAAARFGFAALPTPLFGMHWIVLFGFLSSLAIGLGYFWNRRKEAAPSAIDPLMQALLFFGIAGSGAFAYFVNRSHWQVLLAFSTIGIFPFILLSVQVLFRIERPLKLSLPVLISIATFTGSFSFLNFIPNPVEHLRRIVSIKGSLNEKQMPYVSMVRENVVADELIFVAYPFGHQIAMIAGVRNVFPYATSESVVLKSQLENVTKVIVEQKIKKIFGRLPIELLEYVESHGFKKIQTVDDFTFWALH